MVIPWIHKLNPRLSVSNFRIFIPSGSGRLSQKQDKGRGTHVTVTTRWKVLPHTPHHMHGSGQGGDKRVRNISLFLLLLRKYKSTFHVERQSILLFSFSSSSFFIHSFFESKQQPTLFLFFIFEKLCVNSDGTFLGESDCLGR